MDNIRKGSFVRLANIHNQDLWCEVTSNGGNADRWHVRSWRNNKQEVFILSLSGHAHFIKEVLNLDPAVAKIFRSNMKSTV